MRKLRIKVSTLVVWAALLVIGQLLISQWTIKAAGNRDVIDYISFAGTVVGMILAVLAIVYSYIAGASQKEDSNYLRSQISSLNDVISRANSSGNQFSTELGRLEEIRSSLSRVVSNSEATLEASGRLEGLLAAKMDQEKPEPPASAAEEDGSEDAINFVLSYIASQAIPRQVVFYYIALTQRGMPKKDLRTLKDELVYSTLKDNKRSLMSFYDGEIKGYYWIFYDLDIIHAPEKAKQFKRDLLKRISEFTDESYPESAILNVESLKVSVGAVREKLLVEAK